MSKYKLSIHTFAFILFLFSAFAAGVSAQTTAFTYQGRLNDNAAAANGTYDLQFQLFDAASSGSQVGATVTQPAVNVAGGIFTVQLDFGAAAFDGSNRFLQIGVRVAGTNAAFTTLAGRQQTTAVPYAIRAQNVAATSGNNLVETLNNPATTTTINSTLLPDDVVRLKPATAQVSVGDSNGTGAMLNLRGGSTCCTAPGNFTPADFKVFQNGSFVATGNLGIGVSPMEGKGYRTSWYTYKGAFRSGYADNEWDDANTGFFSWAGGSNSTASGLYALSFGDTNIASSTSSIVFGSGNEVKGAAGFAAGAGNRVCDTYGVAFGNKAFSGGPLVNGKCDTNSANINGLAAVAIGFNVTADRDNSTAMGKFASNNGFSGTFVWSDGSATAAADTFKNTANNEAAFRATGGFRFRTNLSGTTGCNLPAGSGVFSCTSSRALKENFLSVNDNDVLARIRRLPVQRWNYIGEQKGIVHMGTFAEDFYREFGLGTDNRSIGLLDIAGVNLAATKALDQKTISLQAENTALKQQVDSQNAKISELAARLEKLEKLLIAVPQTPAEAKK